MIYLEKLSDDEKKAIEELRKRIKNELPKHMFNDTIMFYRFLKARDFDVDKAENMLRKHISWRKHHQVDTILEDFTPRPFFEKYIKIRYLGRDKSGNFLHYLPMGKMDAREIMKCAQKNEYMKHWIWHLEEIKRWSILKGKTEINPSQATLIIDLENLTLSNSTNKISIELCGRLLNLLQDNYPEGLHHLYVINTPYYYVFAYSILKRMMPNAMIQKIQIFSDSGWQKKLLEVIDADVLPAFLGGNRTDPDGNPLCTTFVNPCGRIHEMYYLPADERDFKNKSLVKRIQIPPNQKKEISVQVAKTDSKIHWEFLIKSKDIGFGLLYKLSELEFQEILPLERYDTVDGVEKGSYKSHAIGTYIIIFENSHSWINAKEVDYCITVSKETL